MCDRSPLSGAAQWARPQVLRAPDAQDLAAEGEAQGTATVLAQGGPGVDRVEVQAGHTLAGKGGGDVAMEEIALSAEAMEISV